MKPSPDAPLPRPEVGGLARHRTDAVSLVFGLVFAGIGVAVLADELDWWRSAPSTTVGIIVAAVGLIAAVATVASSTRRR